MNIEIYVAFGTDPIIITNVNSSLTDQQIRNVADILCGQGQYIGAKRIKD